MRPLDTTLGGPDRFFPETTAGFLSFLRQATEEGYRAALEILCRRYWKPVYAYVRAAWSKTNDDAKDLTQAFFLWLQENGALKRFDEARGGLRPYLKVLLRRFVKDRDVALHRLKRGGGQILLSIDAADIDRLAADARTADPEALFERVWRTELVEQAVDRLRQRCLGEGRATAFAVFESYDLSAESARPTYRDLAARLGLTDAEVRRHLVAIREELLREIRSEIAELASDDLERTDEWNTLFPP